MVRITTWNVNGIRNPFGYQPWRESRSFNVMFDILEADIVIMQELKIQRKDLRDDMVMVPGWDCYFSLPKHKKGYSGVGIYTRQSVCAPIRAEEGLLGVLKPPGRSTSYRDLPEDECIGGYPGPTQVAELGVDPVYLDSEGRCLVLEFPAFVLFGVYSPANSNGQRDDFRHGFTCALDTRIRNLVKMGKNVILTGDLNVSREPIDTANSAEHVNLSGLDDYLNSPNRRIFNQLVHNGKVVGARDEGREQPVLWDICREFHPTREGMYTHWEQKINARPGNFGSRIDYVLCNLEISHWFSDSNIQEGLMGSDHCPVFASTKDVVEQRGEQIHILDILNPLGMFKNGERLRDFKADSDILPMSGKMLPEFDGRRSIKAMFAKKPSIPATSSFSQESTTAEATQGTNETEHSGSFPSAVPEFISPSKPSQKRPASSSPSKVVKRSKSNMNGSGSRSVAKGQQSLKGFFAPKPLSAKTENGHKMNSPKPSSQEAPTSTSIPRPNPSPSSTFLDTPIDEPFIDPEASREGWTKLFSKKPPPRCEGHGDECISYTTKKAGPNCGRMFYLCPRPVGPTGQKERGTQWRCPTFIWASDWKSSD